MKSPAFSFYVRDWLCSRKVASMSGEGVKAFVYLLCESWLQEPRATLPNDDKELAEMARCSESEWSSLKSEVTRCLQGLYDNRLTNERLMEVSNNSETKALNRKNKTGTKTKQNHNEHRTAREDEECIKESVGKISKKEYEDTFNSFWNIYPRKDGKKKSFEKWYRIKNPVQALRFCREALMWQVESFGWSSSNQYTPMPATYIFQERWMDEKPKRGIGDAPTCDTFPNE